MHAIKISSNTRIGNNDTANKPNTQNAPTTKMHQQKKSMSMSVAGFKITIRIDKWTCKLIIKQKYDPTKNVS